MTIDKRNKYLRMMHRRYERAKQVTGDVSMKRNPWDEVQPGHFEVDSIHP